MDTKILLAIGALFLMDKGSLNLNRGDENILDKLRNINLDEDGMERGIEILNRSKKYMKKDEKVVISRIESILDLTRGIKKFNKVNDVREVEDSDFFRSMGEKDKRNMMLKEIIEIFPENKKSAINQAIDMKNKFNIITEIMKIDGNDKNSEKKK